MLDALRNDRQEPLEAAGGQSASHPGWSRKTAGEKPPSAVALSLLHSATPAPESSTKAGQIQAGGSGMAPVMETGGLLGLSCAAWKEIPADKLIFGLVVYFSKVNKPNIYIGLA